MGATVLYVEDEEYDVLFMQRAFAKTASQHQLLVVCDGQKAIDYLSNQQSARPDLILLDLNLPLMSGFEVLKWVRSQELLQKLPVIVFSSSARQEDRVQAQQLGANEYIEKPASALQFNSVVAGLEARWLGSQNPSSTFRIVARGS